MTTMMTTMITIVAGFFVDELWPSASSILILLGRKWKWPQNAIWHSCGKRPNNGSVHTWLFTDIACFWANVARLISSTKKKWRPTFGCLFLPRITVCHATLYLYDMHIMIIYGYWSKPWHLVNPKIAGKWMFIPLELIIIGFDPPPYVFRKSQHETHTETPLGRGPPFAAASVFAKPRGSGSALRF